mgnify:CR=1 FL=1
MNGSTIETIKQEQRYRMLIRNLRKQWEEKEDEKTNDKKTDSNQSK